MRAIRSEKRVVLYRTKSGAGCRERGLATVWLPIFGARAGRARPPLLLCASVLVLFAPALGRYVRFTLRLRRVVRKDLRLGTGLWTIRNERVAFVVLESSL